MTNRLSIWEDEEEDNETGISQGGGRVQGETRRLRCRIPPCPPESAKEDRVRVSSGTCQRYPILCSSRRVASAIYLPSSIRRLARTRQLYGKKKVLNIMDFRSRVASEWTVWRRWFVVVVV